VGTNIEKSKVIDVESSEKFSEKKKLSFGDKLGIFLTKLNKTIDNFKKNQIKRSNQEIERLERELKKTKLQSKIAKNKASINKSKGGNKNKSNDIDWLKF